MKVWVSLSAKLHTPSISLPPTQSLSLAVIYCGALGANVAGARSLSPKLFRRQRGQPSMSSTAEPCGPCCDLCHEAVLSPWSLSGWGQQPLCLRQSLAMGPVHACWQRSFFIFNFIVILLLSNYTDKANCFISFAIHTNSGRSELLLYNS